jgi:hypothetical protein
VESIVGSVFCIRVESDVGAPLVGALMCAVRHNEPGLRVRVGRYLTTMVLVCDPVRNKYTPPGRPFKLAFP